MNGNLFLFRGLPGAGKSTAASLLCDEVFSADDYYIGDDGVYRFDPRQLGNAHRSCQKRTEGAMERGVRTVAVANTFTEEWEMSPYFILAGRHNYRVHTVIVENRHGSESIHNVPEHALKAMKNRFEVVL